MGGGLKPLMLALSVDGLMPDDVEKNTVRPERDELGTPNLVKEVFAGIGIATGLALLWVFEAMRDRYFRLLDRMNVRPWSHRGSAFPAGRPRKQTTVEAQRK
jgi:hypothetical protein